MMFSKAVLLILTTAITAGLARGESFQLTPFADPLHPNNTLANGINDEGQIVGEYQSFQAAFSMGFVYQNGTFKTINHPGANYTVATGINNSGEIVGYYADGFSKVHGFTYDNGTFTAIDGPNGVETWISGINNKGQLVGYYSDTSSIFHGLIYDHGTFMTVDDPSAGLFGSTRLFGVNDAGQVVGEVSSPISGGGNASGPTGFVYENGQFRHLTDAANGISPIPAGINNLGEIAGTAVLNNLSYGFVSTDGSFSYFRDPAYTTTTVCQQTCVIVPIPIQLTDINDAGEIVGFHSYIDITTPVIASFIGTPIPESASASLVAAGLAGVGLLGWLRSRVRTR